ncbi:helix-hairpin-helix domain-containing protein [Isoalcanivorax beigongshangi]|uniref:Helix-hairpin-helix domain-containing protein n=1 Tax=Isoalcanivorax beigongshangi TaxID=3238810 RepID=A0ABV4AFL8_9GAMM
MAFSATERTQLLALKGVGPTVVQRLEQMGVDSFAALAVADVDSLLAAGAALTGSSCWRNSPQARAALTAAVARAQQPDHS